METVIPNIETTEYLKKLEIYDLFPDSIDSIYNRKDKINKKDVKEKEREIEGGENTSFFDTKMSKDEIDKKVKEEIEKGTLKDIANSDINQFSQVPFDDYKVEKNLMEKIKIIPDTKINCITTYNNILLIGINNELKIYDIADNFTLCGTIKVPEYDKNILCLACTEISEVIYAVLGGDFSIIYTIDVLSIQELTGYQLIGHKNKIYQLEFHPYNKHLLLSASKDCTVRLWNFKRPELLVIFGGPKSFDSDVLCIDWNNTGQYFVGSGVDCVVRIYKIDEVLQNCINLSMEKKEVKTILKALPYFSCSEVHDNLIDCIKFNGKFIISKSVDGIIKEWLPTIDSNGINSFFIINIFVFNTRQLILGIKFCFAEQHIIIGNELGQIFFFNKRKTEKTKEVCTHPFFQNNPTLTINLADREKELLIKNVSYNCFYNLLFFGGNNGEVYIYNFQKYNNIISADIIPII